ncbi:hypothetical protein HD599_003432 [Conyzicola lurida]|uniref:Uncharacterized protein n=1 Tax=Conyzicola lurida TaxID=1172621 RepID=A0A841AUL8_9MICO|nr:hypothetical protein [Conyzicola lurida]
MARAGTVFGRAEFPDDSHYGDPCLRACTFEQSSSHVYDLMRHHTGFAFQSYVAQGCIPDCYAFSLRIDR